VELGCRYQAIELVALAGRLRVRGVHRHGRNRGQPATHLSPRVRRALIQITTMTMATTSNSKAIRIESFLQRYFEAFGQEREVFRRVEVDRGVRHRHTHQPIAVALENRTRAMVATQGGELRKAQARKDRGHADV